jgi:hypothetical protein
MPCSKEREDLMLVSHLPFLEKLTSFLLCGDENVRLVLFRYGAIVCLEQTEDKRWAVRWILTPEMANEIKRLFKETLVAVEKILVMGGHVGGIISFGGTLEEAGKILLNNM